MLDKDEAISLRFYNPFCALTSNLSRLSILPGPLVIIQQVV